MEDKKSKKKTTHSSKSTKKARIVHKKKKQINFITPLLVIVAIILVIWGISVFPDIISKDNSDILVIVEGEQITSEDLDLNWDAIPIDMKLSLTKEQVLEELINEKLLLLDAENKGFSTTDEEVDLFVQEQLASLGMNEDDFKMLIEQQGMNISEVKEIYKKQLTISKLFEDISEDELNITEEEIKAYYDANQESFYQKESVTVKHILIEINELINETVALEKSESVLQMFSNGTDFCELVQNYSADLASADSCGEYTFSEGYMVPEFEEAAFEMNVGEVRNVKTEYGYHIILKTRTEDAKQLSLDDEVDLETNVIVVSDLIKQLLMEEKAATIWETYVNKLRQNADIEYMNPISTEIEENTSDENIESFAQCLTDKGIKMYGAYWCSHCNTQKEDFGEAVKYINYVECDESGENSQVELCQEAGIQGFPTWVIDGEQYPGHQTFKRLSELSGCEL